MNKLYVVGIGPGGYDAMTVRALRVLEECEVIVGYTVYIGLIRDRFPGKEFLETPMRQETERCAMALAEAEKGRATAIVCSGDAGVYGMAGPVLELAESRADVEIEVVPGVTAALSGGAVLGAPLMHDFAVISLSDLMTPWEDIEKRLRTAAEADFALCIYNPESRKRRGYLARACMILLEKLPPETVCGAVRNIGREGESFTVTTLAGLKEYEADMFTTVFVGNSRTKRIENGGRVWMATPRGYRL